MSEPYPPGLVVPFVPAVRGGLVFGLIAFALGIQGLFRRGSNRLLALLGAVFGAFSSWSSLYLLWVLPVFASRGYQLRAPGAPIHPTSQK